MTAVSPAIETAGLLAIGAALFPIFARSIGESFACADFDNESKEAN